MILKMEIKIGFNSHAPNQIVQEGEIFDVLSLFTLDFFVQASKRLLSICFNTRSLASAHNNTLI